MEFKFNLFFILILVYYAIFLIQCDCPPNNVTNPFLCTIKHNNKTLSNNDSADPKFDLTQLARNISEYYGNNVTEKQFYYLYIYNYHIEELPENCLLDLSFKIITIGGKPNVLKSIHERAFNSSLNTLSSLNIINADELVVKPSPYNIFTLINSLPNLKFLSLTVPKGYDIIEKSINNSNLLSISLSGINTVNNYAFFGLKNLMSISIDGSFSHISSKAFLVSNRDPNAYLIIDISNSLINASSVESDVFTNINKTLMIVFANNENFQTLPKNLFGELLDKYPKSNITSVNNLYNCLDCNFTWIFERKDEIIPHIIDANCTNTESFYSLTIKDFNHCLPVNIVLIIIIASSSLLLIVILTIVIIFVYKKGVIQNISKKINKYRTDRIIASIVRHLERKKCLIDGNRLHIFHDDVLGNGNFGSVYKALFNEDNDVDIEVAVKTIKSGIDVRYFETCFKEGTMLIDYQHKRVLTPLGVCIGQNGYPMIVLPLMTNGDLLNFLRNDQRILTIKQLLQFGLEIAEGMAFLSSKHFVHRDLAARNCLLDENLCAKISDFGLTREIYARPYYRATSNIPLPIKWMAIESFQSSYYSTKTDVWSFGVLLWEILSRGLEPYPSVDNSDILIYLKSDNRLPKPKLCSEILYKLLLQCWSRVPQHRPHFNYISHFIGIVLENDEYSKTSITPQEYCFTASNF